MVPRTTMINAQHLTNITPLSLRALAIACKTVGVIHIYKNCSASE